MTGKDKGFFCNQNFEYIYLCTKCSTGRKRRLGFGKRGKNSFTVQRSEEVVPGDLRGVGVSRASSASSENDDDRFAAFTLATLTQ